MEKAPKKRGRKPKNKIIINTNPSFEQNGGSDLIASIQFKNKDNNELKDIKISASNENENISCIENSNKSKELVCWNCCEKSNYYIGYPTKYINGVFNLCGNFCCYECAARYIYDNFHNTELIDKYNLLNLYYNINHNCINKVKIAPSRNCLIKFGGNLSYEEYKNNSEIEDILNTYISPIVFINHVTMDKPEYKSTPKSAISCGSS